MEQKFNEEDDSDIDIVLLMLLGSFTAYEILIPRPVRRQITRE